jgi:NAD(P)-dependent dehydrogenase (short-subunit alcohol dehydrogenase family)
MASGSLEGKVALVTGAGRNLGLGIAKSLLSEGCAVAINDLREDRVVAATQKTEASGNKVLGAPFDVSDLAAVQKAVARIESGLGPVDILVNNAGIPEGLRLGSFADSDPATWPRWIDLNLYGSMYCIRTVLPGMIARRWGRIIQISSGAGSQGMATGSSVYGASKAGIEGLIRHVAVEVARQGVTANSIAPWNLEGSTLDAATLEWALSSIPIHRPTKWSEIGAAVLWLASDGGAIVTGQTIHVDGGAIQGR